MTLMPVSWQTGICSRAAMRAFSKIVSSENFALSPVSEIAAFSIAFTQSGVRFKHAFFASSYTACSISSVRIFLMNLPRFHYSKNFRKGKDFYLLKTKITL